MIARLRVVRRATAAETCHDRDPGLSLAGIRQACALAEGLRNDPPLRLKISPCRRARETAIPFAAVFGVEREIDGAYSELPWSDGQTVTQRQAHHRRFLTLSWSATSAAVRQWRENLIAAAHAERGDTLIVSHFLAINALVGRDER